MRIKGSKKKGFFLPSVERVKLVLGKEMNMHLLFFLPILSQNETLPNIWKNAGADPATLMTILVVLMSIVSAVVFGVYRYHRWKNYKEFETEMKSLNLNPEQEGTFSWMVKRYSMEEPVNIIFSPRLFDEMAAREIQNILASSASSKTKSDFINLIYEIRVRTYHPDWTSAEEPSTSLESENA